MRAVLWSATSDTQHRTVRIWLAAARSGFNAATEIVCDVENGGNMPDALAALAEHAERLDMGVETEAVWIPGLGGVRDADASRMIMTRVDDRGHCRVGLILTEHTGEALSRAELTFVVTLPDLVGFARSLLAAARRCDDGFSAELME